MGTNTDPYQHAEGKYHLTQGIIGLLSEARNPFSILTKSTLILRDTAALAAAATRTDVAVNFSVGCLDRSVWRLTEPGLPHPTSAWRRCDASPRPASPAACWWRRSCRGSPTPTTRCGRRSRPPPRPARSPSAGWRCTCAAACESTTSSGSQTVRPDLSALTRERFRGGAYQAQSERDRIAELVRATAHALRGDGTLPPTPPATPVQITPATQLSLL